MQMDPPTFSSLCNHSEPVLAELGFSFLTFSRRKLSRILFLWCLSESMNLFLTERSYLVSFECLGFILSSWDHPDMKISPVNLPELGLNLHLPYLQLEPRHYPAFFGGLVSLWSSITELHKSFVLLPLWETHTHVVPVSAGMLIHLATAF